MRIKKDANPVPKLEQLVNENGDIVYRIPFDRTITIIYRAQIEDYLQGRPLDNTSVWEVINHYRDISDNPSRLDQALPVQ